MSKIGYGYGSEWHLLTYLGYYREELNKAVARAAAGNNVRWIDWPSAGEWKGLDFPGISTKAKTAWSKWWPQTGNVPNWDAVGWVTIRGREELILVEAKAHLEELVTKCGAKEAGGLNLIKKRLSEIQQRFGVIGEKDWLKPYYQYANRLATLNFLLKRKIPAHLIFIYFYGDRFPASYKYKCPQTREAWRGVLKEVRDHLGLPNSGLYKERVHHVFLPVKKTKG